MGDVALAARFHRECPVRLELHRRARDGVVVPGVEHEPVSGRRPVHAERGIAGTAPAADRCLVTGLTDSPQLLGKILFVEQRAIGRRPADARGRERLLGGCNRRDLECAGGWGCFNGIGAEQVGPEREGDHQHNGEKQERTSWPATLDGRDFGGPMWRGSEGDRASGSARASGLRPNGENSGEVVDRAGAPGIRFGDQLVEAGSEFRLAGVPSVFGSEQRGSDGGEPAGVECRRCLAQWPDELWCALGDPAAVGRTAGAEVEKYRLTVVPEADVGRRDVAVNPAGSVDVTERIDDREQERLHLVRRKSLTPTKQVVECAASAILEDQWCSLDRMLDKVDHVGMGKPHEHLRFVAADGSRWRHLHRHIASAPHRPKDGAVPTRTDPVSVLGVIHNSRHRLKTIEMH